MYKKVILLVGVFLSYFEVIAQSPSIEWQYNYGGSNAETAYSLSLDYDGLIVAGFTASNDHDVNGHNLPLCPDTCNDFWLLKTAYDGSLLWQKCYGGTRNDAAYCVIPTRDSGYFACGTTWSNDGNVTGNHSSLLDMWVIKTDHLGNLIWSRCYGGSGTEVAYSATQTKDGGFAITGLACSNNGDVVGHHNDSTVEDIWVLKIDSMGSIEWQKCLGGSGPDQGNVIVQTKDNGYAVFGTACSNDGDVVGLHGTIRDFWLIKLDSLGTTVWQNCIGGYLGQQIGLTMDTTYDGGFILSGTTTYDTGLVTGYHGNGLITDAYVVKVDSLGNIEHELCFGGSLYEWEYSIKQTVDKGYVFTGSTISTDGDIQCSNYDIYIIKIDSAFNIQWKKCLGGQSPEESFSIIQTNDSGFVIAGCSRSNDGDLTANFGESDLWMVKLATDPLTHKDPVYFTNNLNIYHDKKFQIININFNSSRSNSIELELFDITGNSISSQRFLVNTGENHLEYYSGYLNSGLYLFKLDFNNQIIVQKLIIE